MITILVLFLFSSIALYLWLFYENVKRYPKGPLPLPIVGNLHSVNIKIFHEELARFSKDYGNVFTGENWKEQRRTALHILRDFGMGRNLMEEQVCLSGHDLISYLSSRKDKHNMDIGGPLQIFVANVINQTLFGYKYDFNNSERLMSTANAVNRIFAEMRSSKLIFLAQLIPSVLHLPLIGQMIKGKIDNNINLIHRNINEDVEKALKSWNVDQEPECFVHAYYQQMKTNPMLNYENLINVCTDLFLAGMETTSTTLRWAALYLAKYPNVQDKIRNEILSVLGVDGKPSMDLRQKSLPYTHAAVQEIQRCASIVAINPIHRTTKDTSVGSIPIPANTFVIGQCSYALANPQIYKNSEEFQPERFLMEDGVTPNKEALDSFFPFSVGKRQCAGESMAKVELFLGLIMLLQKFKIEPVKGATIDLEPTLATVLVPKPQHLRISSI
ncbi:unspecific monooxygenase [Necator americanus]|uniref:Unspecific monooxygenase n=1 Tax=Necator americanus TaxID=51031 RepID=W2SYL9_NECAM|nr:unspecific monooxygenase [Necator americanus]ETN74653.1 unspecific monooxygenase [Necator americanus]